MSGRVGVRPPHGDRVLRLVDLEDAGHPQDADQDHRNDAGDGQQERDHQHPSGVRDLLRFCLEVKNRQFKEEPPKL